MKFILYSYVMSNNLFIYTLCIYFSILNMENKEKLSNQEKIKVYAANIPFFGL
jgi:hypothetical protein